MFKVFHFIWQGHLVNEILNSETILNVSRNIHQMIYDYHMSQGTLLNVKWEFVGWKDWARKYTT